MGDGSMRSKACRPRLTRVASLHGRFGGTVRGPSSPGGAHRGGIWPGPAQAPVSAYLAEAASAGAAAAPASPPPRGGGGGRSVSRAGCRRSGCIGGWCRSRLSSRCRRWFSGWCRFGSRHFCRSGCCRFFLLATSGKCSSGDQDGQDEGFLHFDFLLEGQGGTDTNLDNQGIGCAETLVHIGSHFVVWPQIIYWYFARQ